jgi:hypothetical protein
MGFISSKKITSCAERFRLRKAKENGFLENIKLKKKTNMKSYLKNVKACKFKYKRSKY